MHMTAMVRHHPNLTDISSPSSFRTSASDNTMMLLALVVSFVRIVFYHCTVALATMGWERSD